MSTSIFFLSLTLSIRLYIGLAQCTELCLQLRGQADKRQVDGARLALQHNLGLGGACVVALYKLGFPSHQQQLSPARSLHTSS